MFQKTVDENGNALASNRLETVTTDRKGKRRLKVLSKSNVYECTLYKKYTPVNFYFSRCNK